VAPAEACPSRGVEASVLEVAEFVCPLGKR
jgi:hypothetical protein